MLRNLDKRVSETESEEDYFVWSCEDFDISHETELASPAFKPVSGAFEVHMALLDCL